MRAMRAAALALVISLTLPAPARAQEEEEPAACDPLSAFDCVYAPGPGNAELRTVIDAAEWEALPFTPWSALSPVGLAAGVGSDRWGPLVAGGSSLETIYELDGLDISGVRWGGSTGASPLPLGFSRRMIVRRGGLGAALRGGTGGLVSLESPVRHGFGLTAYIGSGDAAGVTAVQSAPEPIEWDASGTGMDALAWLGGPAMDGQLHWRAGLGWRDDGGDTRRTFYRLTDRDDDGVADVNDDGSLAREPVDSVDLGGGRWFLPATLHVDFAPDEAQRIEATGFVGYARADRYVFADGEVAALAREEVELTTDAIATWRRRFGRTDVTAAAGVHRRHEDSRSADDARNRMAGGYLRLGSDFVQYESAAVQRACEDGSAADDYPGIINCPILIYWAGGVGAIESDPEARWSARLAATHPLRLRGKHLLQAGADVDATTYSRHVELSGGYSTAFLAEHRFVELGDGPDQCAGQPCRWIDATDLRSETVGYGLYLADDWSPIDSVTLSAGGRYEGQEVDGLGGLADLLPRLSAAWDPMGGGRSRVFASTGGYLGRMPLSFNDRAFAGLDTLSRTIDPDTQEVVDESAFEFTPHAVAGGLGPLRVNELAAGGEVALGKELRAGISYLRRDLGRIIEDVGGPSGALVIANPAARRDRDELAFELRSNPERPLALRASYTWARLRGDWQGFVADQTGQVGPGLLAAFDYPELAANADGPLPPERTHELDVAAAYSHELAGWGTLSGGLRATAWSGRPWSALGNHGAAAGEVHILPRGSLGRAPMAAQVSLRIGYTQQRVTFFVDVFNLFNRQQAYRLDERYTYDEVAPIVGGTPDDLPFLRDGDGRPVTRNPRFGAPAERFSPWTIWLGLRLSS